MADELITRDKLIAAMRELPADRVQPQWVAITEYPHVYTAPLGAMCRYADPRNTAQPSCIVGHAIYALDRAMFEEIADCESSAEEALDAHKMTPDAIQLAVLIQGHADAGSTWGRAIKDGLRDFAEKYPDDDGTPWAQPIDSIDEATEYASA
jgi:hypothetical protein